MPSRMAIDLIRIIASITDANEEIKPGAVVQHAFGRAVAADALSAGLRAESSTATACSRTIARDALFQKTQRGIQVFDNWMRVKLLIFLTLRARWHSSQTVELPAPMVAPFGGRLALPMEDLDHQVDHRCDLV